MRRTPPWKAALPWGDERIFGTAPIQRRFHTQTSPSSLGKIKKRRPNGRRGSHLAFSEEERCFLSNANYNSTVR